jgi:hypothetical protein
MSTLFKEAVSRSLSFKVLEKLKDVDFLSPGIGLPFTYPAAVMLSSITSNLNDALQTWINIHTYALDTIQK